MVTITYTSTKSASGRVVGAAVGKSTDTKPTFLGNGSSFTEIDTSKFYLFDEDATQGTDPWVEQEQ